MKPKKSLSNSSDDSIVSIKKLFKEPSPDKFCSVCKTKLPNNEKWKNKCTKCFFKKEDICLF
jgi:hypothetical protein